MSKHTPDLIEALQRLLRNSCPLSGDPTHAELIEFWISEQKKGREAAGDMLFALRAIAKATEEQP